MSEWNDPGFDKIYKVSSDDGDHQSFVGIANKLKKRQPGGNTFSKEDLTTIQTNFHNLMRYRCRRAESSLQWLDDNKDSLPTITNALLNETEPQWFAVSGMYGGFSYGLLERDGGPLLITDSWIRIVGGSGEQHEITPGSVELVAKGFV